MLLVMFVPDLSRTETTTTMIDFSF